MSHYYTIRNRVTGEKSLVLARGRGEALAGFARRRLEVTFTSQQELLDLTRAGVLVLDLVTKADGPAPAQAPPDGQRALQDPHAPSTPLTNACA